MDAQITLVVGNGLTIDFVKHASPQLDAWGSSKPLSWQLVNPFEPGASFYALFPRLTRALTEVRHRPDHS